MRQRSSNASAPLFPGLRPAPSAAALREAFDSILTRMTYDEYMADPARAICVRNIAAAIERRRHHLKENT